IRFCFSSRRRHTRSKRDWSSDVCSSDLASGLFLLFIIYSCFSALLGNQINAKEDEANESIASTTRQIQLASTDNEKIKSKTNERSEERRVGKRKEQKKGKKTKRE